MYGAFFYDRNFLGLSNHSAGLYFRSLSITPRSFWGWKTCSHFFDLDWSNDVFDCSAYLIAGAVKESGLGERIAYKFIISYVTSFKSIIVAIFILTFILSLLIPHPWPRAFLIMSVMAVVIKSANIPRVDAVKIGFTVFAASVPVSLIFLTGDATISPLAVQSSGVSLGWLGWFNWWDHPVLS